MSKDALETWDALSAEWRVPHDTSIVDLTALRTRARAHSRWLRALAVAEVLVSAIMVVLAVLVLRERRDSAAVVWAAAMGMALVVTWTFTINNRRGLWQAAGERTSDYVLLTSARARAALRTVRFIRWFLGVLWVGYAALYLTATVDRPSTGFASVLWVAGVAYSVALVVWSEWYRRRASRDLRVIHEVERTLVDDTA